MCTKLVELFANRVVERRNMINDYLRGELALRVLRELISGGVLILNFCVDFELFLPLLCHFAWLCHFSCHLLAFAVFLLLDDILYLFLAFGSSSCAS
jgi:hypothetical protein